MRSNPLARRGDRSRRCLRVAGTALVALLGFGVSACRSHAAPSRAPAVAGAPRVVAPAPQATPPPVTVAPPAPVAFPPPGTLIDHRDGKPVSFEAVAERAAGVSVVYVGEFHDQAEAHRLQMRMLEALAARKGGPLALGMEMFSKPFQPALDAYVRGEIDEAALLEKTEWKTRWGFGWEMYAPMLRFCRDHKIAVIALNAPKEITRAVAKGGLESLTPEQKATLPPLDMNDAGHRAFVREAFGAHGAGMPAEKFERFYTAQVIWEEVMSSSVAQWLSSAGPGARMLVVVGAGHVADRFGIPARAARKSGASYLTVVARILPSKDENEPSPGRADVRFADYAFWLEHVAPPPATPVPATPAPGSKASPPTEAPPPPTPAIPAPELPGKTP